MEPIQNPKIQITPQTLSLIAEIDEFKGQWSTLTQLYPERLQRLKTVATIESVGSSTRIEGSKLSDQEVEKLLGGLRTDSFRSRDEEEVAGYAEAIQIIFGSFNEIDLTENYIKQLHQILLKHSTKDERHRGEYKKLSNNVEIFNADGKSLGIVFEAASPFETPERMRELLAWTHQHLKEKSLHPLLITTVFVLNFLAIHPFQDGNGRLSRILTTWFLLRQGYSYIPYSSLEHVIEQNKDQYYLTLRRSQKNLGNPDENLEDWTIFFLNSLKAQKENLIKKIHLEKRLLQLSVLSQEILKMIKEQGRASNAELQTFTQANRNTIKLHLRKLVKEKLLAQHGKGKGTWYSLL